MHEKCSGAPENKSQHCASGNQHSPGPAPPLPLDNDTFDDSSYYTVLNVDKTANSGAIRKAYHKLALKYHPDKYRGGNLVEAAERFKSISHAYEVLSDPKLKERYDEFGTEVEVTPDEGFTNPQDLFQGIFGGNAFVDIIGQLKVSRDFSNSSPEEQQVIKARRVVMLTRNLQGKIASYVDHPALQRKEASASEKKAAIMEFEEKITKERDELRDAPHGVELLHAIGYMYSLKARQFLGKDSFFGFRNYWNNLRETGNMAYDYLDIYATYFRYNSATQKVNENAPENEKEAWQQRAPIMGIDTIWKVSRMDINEILSKVCDLLLSDFRMSRQRKS
eukprot:Partr_v1_DN23244_c0_g1_i3_m35328 putative DnaJ (Hsp40) homolog subfamily C member